MKHQAAKQRSGVAVQQSRNHLFSVSGGLTAPSAEPPRVIADRFLASVAPAWGLTKEDLAGAYVAREYQTAHNGVTHLIYRQRFDGVDVYDVAWKINIDRDGQVINAGGSLAARPIYGAPAAQAGMDAVRTAVRDVSPSLDGSYLATSNDVKGQKYVRFARGGFADPIDGRPVWYRVSGVLRPAWLVHVPDENGRDSYATVVDALSQRILAKHNTTQYQRPQPPVRGLVFERESPQPNPQPGVLSAEPRPYVERTVQPFTGDPVASPNGWVNDTATIGNNVYAGENPFGRFQLRNPEPTVAPDRNFSFPLELGPGAPNPTNFKDAATTNLFYWANKAHDLFYGIGFDEASGNYQQDNFGRGGIGGDPMIASSHFGIARSGIAEIDNSFYLVNRDFEDGARATINMFLSGSHDDKIFSDGSYDAEVIVHEYTHGVSNRLVENFRNAHGGAMGEAWSDFYALEFTIPPNAPADGSYTVGEYLFQTPGLGVRSRPYSTDMNVNPLTFGDFGRVSGFGPEVHYDGEIWASALWEARANLVKQLGDKEGRRRMGILVLDGMKLAPPSPSMVDARDAILLADRVDFKGESQQPLWEAFARRGLGVVAMANNANSVNVTTSFVAPGNGTTLRFDQTGYTIGEIVRVILYDPNNKSQSAQVQLTSSSGDLENLMLRKQGDTFYGTIPTGGDGVQEKFDSFLDVIPGDYVSVYYVDRSAGRLIETTAPVAPPYSFIPQSTNRPFVSGQERSLFTVTPGNRTFLSYRPVVLPFAFPFFGRTHRLVYVSADGLLTFDTPVFAQCNDVNSFSQMTAIAPMYMELVYGGRAQQNENVYWSADAGSATFRWAAETAATGEPVNFSVVIFSDGRIQFQYGSGNNNLVNSPFLGCNANTPLIGVSKGTEGFVLSYEDYMGSPNLANAPTVVVDPPFSNSSIPVVRLETPEANGNYQGVLTVRGIAYDDSDYIARLDILIDGNPRRLAAPTVQRTDFCATERVRGCPLVGFQASIDLNYYGIAPGEHSIQIRATNTRGAFKDYPDQPVKFTIDPGQSRLPVGRIEMPAEGAAISGSNVTVRGWAYAPDLRIASVDVLVDGVTYGQAQYGQRRDDVCGSVTGSRPPNCPNVGFNFALNTVAGALQLPNGPHLLQVRARDEANRYTLIPDDPIKITVNNAVNQAPTGVLSNPQPNQRLRGIVKIWGWAWDPDGTVAGVDLIVDNIILTGVVRYGSERAEQCATIPDAPAACPNIGFEGDLDTSIFGNGLHRLGVRIRDDKGRVTYIPGSAENGMNVYFEN